MSEVGVAQFAGVDGIDEAVVVISYRGQTWYARGVLTEAEIVATLDEATGTVGVDEARVPLSQRVSRELTLRLNKVEFETEGTPRLIP